MRYILLICLLLVSGAGMRAQIPELGVSKRMVDTCTINFDHPEAGDYIRLYARNFLDDSARGVVSPAFYDTLFMILEQLPDCTFEVASHTTSDGPAARNYKMSLRRSSFFVHYLVTYCGMKKERLQAVGYGENCPLIQCTDGETCTPEQKEKNQRLEIMILSTGNEEQKTAQPD